MSTTSPSSRRSQSGSARPILILLLAVIMFAAGAATSWWYLTQEAVKTAAIASPSPGPDFGPLAPPAVAQVGAGRSFVLGTTVVESRRSVGRDLQGFESSDVGVKRAPKVEGLLDLVMLPATPKEGDPYSVQVFLKNEGKKAIEVD